MEDDVLSFFSVSAPCSDAQPGGLGAVWCLSMGNIGLGCSMDDDVLSFDLVSAPRSDAQPSCLGAVWCSSIGNIGLRCSMDDVSSFDLTLQNGLTCSSFEV